MRGMVFTAFPYFVEQKCAWLIGAAMQIVLQAAFFFSCGADEGSQLGLQKQVLAFLGAEHHDQGQRALGKFGDFGAARLTAGAPLERLLRFSFGHVGGDFTPNAPKRNGNCSGGRGVGYFSASLRPAFRLSKFSRVLRTRA
jgi:hypothetical protein